MIGLVVLILISYSLYYIIWKKKLIRKPILIYIAELSEQPFFKQMSYKEGSKDYQKAQELLEGAGFNNITVGMYQVIKLLVPLAVFVILLLARISIIYNSIIHFSKVQISEEIGEFSANTSLMLINLIAISLGIYFAIDYILKTKAKIRTIDSNKEVVLLMTYAIMMLKIGRSVKSVMLSLFERSDIFRPKLEKAVRSYSVDPHESLQTLKEECQNEQFAKICIGMEQALNTSTQASIAYLESHKLLSNEMERINIKKKNAQKSMFSLLLLILPLSALFVVVGYPWFVFAMNQIANTAF